MKQPTVLKQRAVPWLLLTRIAWCIVASGVMALVITSLVIAITSSHLKPPGPHACANCQLLVIINAQTLGKLSWLNGTLYYMSVLCIIFALCHFMVAAVLVWRKSDDWLALFAAFTLVLLAITFCDRLPTLPPFWHRLDAYIMYSGLTGLFLFFCLFPQGHLTPWWSYILAALAICYGVSYTLFQGTFANPLENFFPLNPLMNYGLIIGLALLQIYRYRRISEPGLRWQTRWVVLGMCSAVIVYLAQQMLLVELDLHHGVFLANEFLSTFAPPTLFFLALLLVPLSIAMAILHSHLWNIDLLIHRTLVYGALSACVVGLYILVVGGLGTLLQDQGNILLSLLATGLIAILFQPLRERLQRAVNYLVYGERNDPYQVLSRLSKRLATTLVPNEILSTMVETIAQTFKLSYVALLLHQGEQADLEVVHGQTRSEEKLLRLALTYQGEMLGELVVSNNTLGEPFSARDQRLLEDLTHHAGTAAHVVRLNTTIQRSREQLVTTREEERRRLRRDLHDGLGPQLASLMLVLTMVRKTLRTNPAGAERTLTEAMTHLQEAIYDIRRLVYGLRPPALDDLGLLAALQEDLRHYQASGIACRLEAPETLPALPAAVEVACYRIIREALTNVLKHAQARQCSVRISVSTTLDLEVTDDGKGLPAGWRPGVGLTSLRERAQELGGSCNIQVLNGGGTRVVVHLPWQRAEQVSDQQRKDTWYGTHSLSHS